jgi:hypothetical protein
MGLVRCGGGGSARESSWPSSPKRPRLNALPAGPSVLPLASSKASRLVSVVGFGGFGLLSAGALVVGPGVGMLGWCLERGDLSFGEGMFSVAASLESCGWVRSCRSWRAARCSGRLDRGGGSSAGKRAIKMVKGRVMR